MSFEQPTDLPENGNKITRRKFLKILGGGIVAASGAASTACEMLGDKEKPEKKKEDPFKVRKDGFELELNQEGIPLSVTHEKNRETVSFSYDQKMKFKKIAELAMAEKGPELAMVIPFPFIQNEKIKEKKIESEKETIAEEKIEGCLTRKELSECGIRIFQTDQVKLGIRKSAFRKGEIFERFQAGEKERLDIVLLPGGAVVKDFLIGHDFDEIRPRFRGAHSINFWDKNRKASPNYSERLEKIEKEIQTLKQELDRNKRENKGQEVKNLEERIMNELLSKYILTQYSLDLPEQIPAGVYLQKTVFNNPVILVAVGEEEFNVESAVIWVDSSGKFQIQIGPSHVISENRIPQIKDSHPNPSAFEKLKPGTTRQGYLIGGVTAGVTLRHEASHYVLIDKNSGKESNYSEKDTDLLVMKSITKAFEKWKKSKKTDSSGYHFVFKTPQGLVYTEAEKEQDNV